MTGSVSLAINWQSARPAELGNQYITRIKNGLTATNSRPYHARLLVVAVVSAYSVAVSWTTARRDTDTETTRLDRVAPSCRGALSDGAAATAATAV